MLPTQVAIQLTWWHLRATVTDRWRDDAGKGHPGHPGSGSPVHGPLIHAQKATCGARSEPGAPGQPGRPAPGCR